MHVTLAPGSFALVLPDSISPYKDSSYVQAQRFVLPDEGDGQEGGGTASVLILDWVNSGRGRSYATEGGDGEVWQMESYESLNEVLVGKRRIMRERMILRDDLAASPSTPPHNGPNGTAGTAGSTPQERTTGATGITDARTNASMSGIARKLAPYHVYATVLMYGPHVAKLLDHLREVSDKSSQFQLHRPPSLAWSFSDLCGEGGKGGVMRIAAKSVEEARDWLRAVLLAGGIKEGYAPMYAASMTISTHSSASGRLIGSTSTCILLRRRLLPLPTRVCRSRRTGLPGCVAPRRARRKFRAGHVSSRFGAASEHVARLTCTRLVNASGSTPIASSLEPMLAIALEEGPQIVPGRHDDAPGTHVGHPATAVARRACHPRA